MAPFTILIPARLASTRLPDKPLADIAGKPMVVRVAERVLACGAAAVVVAADHDRILAACAEHGIDAILTDAGHASGSDRLAQACTILGLDGDDVVVNVQGDEPLIEPDLVQQCAALLAARSDCVMSTVAQPIHSVEDYLNPHIVKVVLDRQQRALLFSRAPLPWWRDAPADGPRLPPPMPVPLRHVGLYGYRAAFLRRFPLLSPAPLETSEALEQLRVLWHGERIAVHVSPTAGAAGVDTPEDLARVRAWYAARPASA
jgi:3-deoxy-manno-octulosonate cytidylyltransferase (CMP-KDO synthetase)